VVIVLPKGSYVPRFEHRTIAFGGTAGFIGKQAALDFRWLAPVAMAAAALIAAIALISYRELAPSNVPSGPEAERAAAASDATAISIAVLPFLNLSGDASQEFFSDGMTEEITATLARIPDLKVVARTSAFQFKGQNRDIQSIGQQLHATHLIEGSVRKDGTRVRITAQLIEAESGVHVSSERYDRELSDIFTTQEDIARNIIGALMAPLGLGPGERLIANRNIDPESYQQYLRARALVHLRNFNSMTDAAALLEQVVVRAPDYAPAWAMLAQAYALTPAYHARASGSVEELRRVLDAFRPKAEQAAQRAVQLDPNSAEGYVPLGYLEQLRGNLLLAEDLFAKGLALDPNHPDSLQSESLLLGQVGRLKEALAMRQHLQLVEPFVPAFNELTAESLWLNGQDDAAIAMFRALPSSPGRSTFRLARVYAAMGRYSEAADTLLSTPAGLYAPGTVEAAARLLRSAPTGTASLQDLPPLSNLGFVDLHVGAPNRALEYQEMLVEVGWFAGGNSAFWHPSYSAVRKTERFKAFVLKAGMVDYWRARGWPEFCRPTIGDDFVCE
jgi:TolB-like protein/tetratricopeptide (TPR) repeat protein